jgi:hypothetical protein
MRRFAFITILILGLGGCYAGTKATVKLTQTEQKMNAARAAGAPERAIYAWTMADEYMKKARDEWGRSDYESAEALLKKAEHWAAEAVSIARANGDVPPQEALQDAPSAPSAPEEPQTSPQGVW